MEPECSRLKQRFRAQHFVFPSQRTRKIRATVAIFRYPEHVNFLAPSPGCQDDVEENAPQRALVEVHPDPPYWQ
jgi:hypothetical protein